MQIVEVSKCITHLLASSDDLFEVILGGESLNGGESLSPVPLLDPDVHHPLLARLLVTFGSVGERIESLEIGKLRHFGRLI